MSTATSADDVASSHNVADDVIKEEVEERISEEQHSKTAQVRT